MSNRLYNFLVKQAGSANQLMSAAETTAKELAEMDDLAIPFADIVNASLKANLGMMRPSALKEVVRYSPKGDKVTGALFPFLTLPGNTLNSALVNGVSTISHHPKTSAAVAALGGGGYLGKKYYDSKNKSVTDTVKDSVGDLDLGQLLSNNKFALGGGVGGAGLGALLGGDTASKKLLGALLGGGAGAGLGYLADKYV